jgi:zinc protease
LRPLKTLIIAVVVASAFTPFLFAEDLDLAAPLPVDPGVTKIGTLENGLTYWIRPNQTPPKKVGVLLHIDSGSLNETEEQRGVAHFLEHMAFNGSENFPPGKVVPFFESLGMVYGSDQNAFTSFNQTTYFLTLPDNTPKMLENGFLYLSDVAGKLSLIPEEIDRERGVIAEERRARSGAGMRLMEKTLPILAPGSRLSERMPIGLPEVIQKADRKVFMDYYRTWYRPENTTVIVCGDIETDAVEKLIRKTFGGWKAEGESRKHAEPGVELSKGLRAAVVTDKEVTSAEVGINIIRELRTDRTVGDFRRGLVEQLGGIMMNRRFSRMVQEGKAPFQSASLSGGPFVGYFEVQSADATGEPEDVIPMFKALLVELMRAREHGFREDEFELAKRAVTMGLTQAAAREATTDSVRWMMRMNQDVANGEMPMSIAQGLELTKKLMPGIALKEVHKAFADAAALDKGLIIATLPEKEGVELPTEEQLLAAHKEAIGTKVEDAGKASEQKGLLAKEPEPGKVAATNVYKEIGVTSVTFENGVAAHVKPTDFRKDMILVSVRIVGGPIQETAANRGISMVSAVALTPGMAATSRHSPTELADLLTGRKFNFRGMAADAEMELSLMSSPDELDDAFRLLHVLLTEPKLDETSINRWKLSFLQQVDLIETNVGVQANLATDEILTGGDPRFTLPSKEHMEALTAEKAQAWLDGILKSAPIEVAISGDVETERALELSRRYLGSLAKRPTIRPEVEALRKVTMKKGPHVRTLNVKTITPQAVVRVGWRAAPRGDRPSYRAQFFASQVATARLLKVIREEKGLTYSIQCATVPSTAYDGNGCIFAIFTAAPDKAAEAAGLTKQVLLDMVKNPPTEEEMQSVAAQLKNMIETQMRQPQFWTQVLSNLRTSGRDINEIRDLLANYTSVTKEQIVKVLTGYLTEDRYFQVIATPPVKKADGKE